MLNSQPSSAPKPFTASPLKRSRTGFGSRDALCPRGGGRNRTSVIVTAEVIPPNAQPVDASAVN